MVEKLNNGAKVLYKAVGNSGTIVLAEWEFDRSYVTWIVDAEGNAYWGHYFGTDLNAAKRDFNARVVKATGAAFSK